MIKTFVIGFIVSAAGVIAGLYWLPIVDVTREASIITVTPNGGNSETFHVNIPSDRIMVGAQGQREPLPAGLEWPADPIFADARAEVFKLRNTRDAVVGTASRVAIDDPGAGEVLEWVLHLPARGSVYASMSPATVGGGGRVGQMRVGTREFTDLEGEVREQWVADTSRSANGDRGRIELATRFVSTRPVDDEEEAE